MPPPYPGPFIPGQVSDLASPHPVPTVPNDLISGADEASGGVDVIEKWPIGDNDEGHFVPDDVEMNAKLAEAIPPPPSFNYDQRHHRHHDRHHRHRQRPVSQQQQHREDSSCFVPDDAVPDRLTAARPRRQVSMPGCTTPVSAGCRRQTSANTCGSDSSTAISFNVSGCSSPATGFTASSSSRRCSPPSFFVPSTTSSSVSSQSPLVYTDDPDTTQTDIDYY